MWVGIEILKGYFVEIILSSKSINLKLSEYPNNATLLAACQTMSMKTLIDVTNSQSLYETLFTSNLL